MIATNPKSQNGLLLPRTLGGVFDEAFDLYKRHFTPLFLMLGIIFLPIQILLFTLVNLWVQPLTNSVTSAEDTSNMAKGFLVIIGYIFAGEPHYAIPGLISLFFLAIMSGAVTHFVHVALHEKSSSIGASYRRLFSCLPRLCLAWMSAGFACICLYVLLFILITIVLSLILAGIIAVFPASNEVLSVIFVVLIFLLPYLGCCFFAAKSFLFTTPIVVIEDIPLSYIPNRNLQLTTGKKRFRRYWWAVVFLPLVIWGLRILTLQGISIALMSFPMTPFIRFIVDTSLTTILYLFFEPYWMICITLLYFDCRVYREGYDLNILAENV